MERLQFRPCLKPEQIEPYINGWKNKMGDWCTVRKIGESGGYPIMMAEMTNPSVPDCEKETALLVAQHSIEISGPNTIFSVGNYLAQMGDLAKEILSKQRVVLIPCANMFSYSKMDEAYQFKNHAGVDEYAGAFNAQMEVDKERTPAAYAIKQIIDEYQPELFIDAHGLWQAKTGIGGCTGAYSFSALNACYDTDFVNAMNNAARKKGYALGDESYQQTIRPCNAPVCTQSPSKFRAGSPSITAGGYAYIKYHTLNINMEVSFEKSGLIRIIEALRLGCHPICPTATPGYPVRVVRSPMCSEALVCGGNNAEERRLSRVEIWNQGDKLGHALFAMQIQGLQTLMISLCHDTVYKTFGHGGFFGVNAFLDGLESQGYAVDKVREIYKDIADQCHVEGTWANAGERANITHGMTIRFRLPFDDAKIETVIVNNVEYDQSQYVLFRHENCTFVEIPFSGDLPDLILATVKYDFADKPTRKYGIVEF